MITEAPLKILQRHFIFILLLFSILYWIAALGKPYHVDEFYSWVYCRNSTIREIFLLKDSGIGHPPLYHLMQKGVQYLFPESPSFLPRVVNYVAGTGFIFLLANHLLRYKAPLFFIYAVCASAGILEIFIFSRMYGLTVLIALSTFLTGEQYVRSRKHIYLTGMFILFALGFFADYSFVLLMPFLLIIVLIGRKDYRKYVWMLLAGQCVCCFLIYCMTAFCEGNGAAYGVYWLAKSVIEINYHVLLRLFTFFFEETLLIGVFFIAGVHFAGRAWNLRGGPPLQGAFQTADAVVGTFVVFLLIYAVGNHHLERLVFLIPLTGLLFYSLAKNRKLFFNTGFSTTDSRLCVSVMSGVLLLLTVNPLFWRNLIDKRFCALFLPFLIILMARNLPPVTLRATAVVLMGSTALYLFSNGLSNYFPPSSVDQKGVFIFQDEFAYANRYFRSQTKEQPYLLDFSKFDIFCRVCKMGTDDIPFHEYNVLQFICRSDFNPDYFVPDGYKLAEQRELLTALDTLQFSYLRPVCSTRFALSVYSRRN